MFTKVKNLLKIRKNKKKEDDNLGCISYNLLHTGEIEVKINLDNLEEDSIEKFASLFARVTTTSLAPYTINLVKQLFMEIDEESYVKMILLASKECEKIIEENESQKSVEDAYIKPSEMFNE
jgi:hypothetical protein|tara:strand:- start:158 stop:523 length:366 start_codon:yes stop_codon:yes gene_type:complete